MKRPGFAVFVCVCPKSATWESLRASGVQGMETMEKVAWTLFLTHFQVLFDLPEKTG